MTGTAGEHYVAYCLSRRGLLPALTRGGSPSVDILVASRDGSNTVSIQVKTSSSAKREFVRKKQPAYWLWDVGERALTANAPRLFYAFVDLRYSETEPLDPVVFIVPSSDVCRQLKPKDARYMFWIEEGHEHEYKERWDRLEEALQ
jgi:hypothetical protein